MPFRRPLSTFKFRPKYSRLVLPLYEPKQQVPSAPDWSNVRPAWEVRLTTRMEEMTTKMEALSKKMELTKKVEESTKMEELTTKVEELTKQHVEMTTKVEELSKQHAITKVELTTTMGELAYKVNELQMVELRNLIADGWTLVKQEVYWPAIPADKKPSEHEDKKPNKKQAKPKWKTVDDMLAELDGPRRNVEVEVECI